MNRTLASALFILASLATVSPAHAQQAKTGKATRSPAPKQNVKRLQPGRAVTYSAKFSALEHDCSTLGGNSGSPVVDLETHEVIGLHFGGRYGVGNYAVPLWMLTADPLLAKGEVNFR